MKGTYCLLIEIKEPGHIEAGMLGKVKIERGCYVYVGSAFNSLEARIRRHLSEDKRIHWHVDYLLSHDDTRVADVIFTTDRRRLECSISRRLQNPKSIKGFGCSDCNCKSHLHYYNDIDEGRRAVIKALKSLNAKVISLEPCTLWDPRSLKG